MDVNNLNYFDIESITSQADLKKIYRQQSKVLHPDAGGSTEQFQQLTKEFDYITQNQLYDANIRKDFKVNKANAKNVTQPKNAHPEDFYKSTDFAQETASKAAKNAKASKPTSANLPAVIKNEGDLTVKTLDQTAKSKGLLETVKGLPKEAKIAAGLIAGTAVVAGIAGKKKKDEEKGKPSKKELKNERIKNKIKRENNMKNVESWRLINNDLDNARSISQFSKGHSTYKL